jgi:phage terminase large subunit-like protein
MRWATTRRTSATSATSTSWCAHWRRCFNLNAENATPASSAESCASALLTPSVLSLRAALQACADSHQETAFLAGLRPDEIRRLSHDWVHWTRPNQLPPETEDWRSWLVLGGRGSGKTRTGAEWVRACALGKWAPVYRKAERIAIVAPTFDEARLVMIEGQSGLLSVHGASDRPKFEPSKRLITWEETGAIAQIFTAEEPDGLRGPQFDAAWCDELSKWKHPEEAWNMLQFALRLGEHPQAVITTTPRPIPLVKRLLLDRNTAVSRSSTFDNAKNLAQSFLDEVKERYGRTDLGRQELLGEILEDDKSAMFKRALIEFWRVPSAPVMERVVVAVDPPAGTGRRANACGIVCAGLGVDGRCYVLDDHSEQGLRPHQWAARALGLYHAREAHRVVAEINQGGAMVEQVIREVEPDVPFKAVHATRAKKVRAEPVAALYEQGRVSHVGHFAALEDEMCVAFEGRKRSPDRLDALVWAVTELMLRPKFRARVEVL